MGRTGLDNTLMKGDDSLRLPSRFLSSHTYCSEIPGMAESVGIGSGVFKVGSGLIEIAALTALVGSSTAQSLMLGNRGAVGLVWAAMSMFGVLSMIKACLAAAIPAWLRDTLGVRGVEADEALGLSLTLEKEEFKARNSVARDTVGIVSEIHKVSMLRVAQLKSGG